MSPALASANPEALLARVEWTVLRRLDGLLQGDYRTLFQGMGLDFADLRPYQHGDDVRTIDWNVTARWGEPHVRRFHEDRDLKTWFLVDTSPSLDFGSVGLTKLDRCVELVAALASLLTRGGNKVGACLYDGALPRLIPAAGGRAGVLALLRSFQLPPPEGAQPETDLSVLLDAMAGVLRRRSLIFLISDFYGPPHWAQTLGTLARRHEVVTVRVTDPSEGQLPDVGVVWLEDAETGGQMLVDTSDRALRLRYGKAEAGRTETLTAAFRHAQVTPFALATDDDLVRTLLGWAGRRRAQKTFSGGAK